MTRATADVDAERDALLEAHGGDTVTARLLSKSVDFVLETMAALKTALGTRADALEARIAALESRPSLQHRGTWSAAENYPPQSAVTDGGSVWISRIASKGVRPGSGDGVWQLAVKRGRDGRDVR